MSRHLSDTAMVVWSLDVQSGRWLVVDEGNAKDMLEGAARRERTRIALGLSGAYIALPRGQEPTTAEAYPPKDPTLPKGDPAPLAPGDALEKIRKLVLAVPSGDAFDGNDQELRILRAALDQILLVSDQALGLTS